jgi:hypothetical protein
LKGYGLNTLYINISENVENIFCIIMRVLA